MSGPVPEATAVLTVCLICSVLMASRTMVMLGFCSMNAA